MVVNLLEQNKEVTIGPFFSTSRLGSQSLQFFIIYYSQMFLAIQILLLKETWNVLRTADMHSLYFWDSLCLHLGGGGACKVGK